MADRLPPAFVVDAGARVAEEAFHDRSADGLVARYAEALGVAGEGVILDEMDREDWVEQAFRVVSCIEAADAHGIPVWALRDGGGRLAPLNAAAVASDPAVHSLVLWGLHGPRAVQSLASRGLDASDPFGEPPSYWRSPAFIANAGRRFTVCRSDDDPLPGMEGLPTMTEALRREVGNEVVHKILDGTLKEYSVTRFVPTEAEPMPEDVAWSVVHRSMNEHSIQEAVDMAYEYRLFVVDGTVVSGAGSVMEHTPLDRGADCGTYAPWARRDIRGKGGPEEPAEVDAYRQAGQGLVDAVLAHEGMPRHVVMDLYTTPAGGVGIVEMNPLNGSGYFANDAMAVGRAVVEAVLAHAPEPLPSPA